MDGRSETLASAVLGDRAARYDAERLAAKLAVEIQQGVVVAGAVSEMIERFELKEDPTYYEDQSVDGKKTRKAMYANLTKFFGRMSPADLTTQHGYQYLEDRAAAGAPVKANKEISQLSVICHYGVRWGLLPANPFTNMMKNRSTTKAKVISRGQVLRFYLWSVKQRENYRVMGCAAMFTYLTGFRSSETRPFLKTGLTEGGVTVLSSKRKKGQMEVLKIREWSTRLRVVVARALDRQNASPYLFAPTKRSEAYTRHGWASSWKDAQMAWILTFDEVVKEETLTAHPQYFTLQDIRPAAITQKIANRDHDAYDFAAHADPSTTHKHYDRRLVKRATATE